MTFIRIGKLQIELNQANQIDLFRWPCQLLIGFRCELLIVLGFILCGSAKYSLCGLF